MEMSLLHRRERIITSTIETMNEVGIQNLSTKLIAKREGVSEGTLFRHFKNKTEIMQAALERFSQFDDAIIQTCFIKNYSAIDSIKYFFKMYSEYYQSYPEITVIPQAYDSLLEDPNLSDLVKNIIAKRFNFIFEKIKEAEKSGILKAGADPELLTVLLFGGSNELCFRWRMDNYKFSIKTKNIEMVDTIVNSFFINNNKGGDSYESRVYK